MSLRDRATRLRRVVRILGALGDDELAALSSVARWVADEHTGPLASPTISPAAWISPLASIRFAERVEIGRQVAVGPFASVWGGFEEGWARIGDETQIGPGALITAGDHAVDGPGPVRSLGFEVGDVTIGSGAWIGANAVIISCAVGEGAVIGAGAVVTKDVPPRAVAVGAPARVIRYRGDG